MKMGIVQGLMNVSVTLDGKGTDAGRVSKVQQVCAYQTLLLTNEFL